MVFQPPEPYALTPHNLRDRVQGLHHTYLNVYYDLELMHGTRDRNKRIKLAWSLRNRINLGEDNVQSFIQFVREQQRRLDMIVGTALDEDAAEQNALGREVAQVLLTECLQLLLEVQENFKLARNTLDGFVSRYQIPIP